MSEQPTSKPTANPLTEDEWMRRLRARFIERAGDGAYAVADAVYEEWRGGFEDDPEGAADEEMSYWGCAMSQEQRTSNPRVYNGWLRLSNGVEMAGNWIDERDLEWFIRARAAVPPNDDRRDAERYRFLRNQTEWLHRFEVRVWKGFWESYTGKGLDEAIDSLQPLRAPETKDEPQPFLEDGRADESPSDTCPTCKRFLFDCKVSCRAYPDCGCGKRYAVPKSCERCEGTKVDPNHVYHDFGNGPEAQPQPCSACAAVETSAAPDSSAHYRQRCVHGVAFNNHCTVCDP